MTKLALRKTDSGWFVRQSYSINGASVQRTSYYDKFGTALIKYIKLALRPNSK
ncbi:MAG: hypothetical protein J5742_01900 [Alphaproteobacteria bacterium]|nr:hypothetical protein [Alphaproteobacteria bacterium]